MRNLPRLSRLAPTLVVTFALLFGATAAAQTVTAPSTTNQSGATCANIAYPYTPTATQRWWNCTHNPNIDRATASIFAGYLNASVQQALGRYLFIVWLNSLPTNQDLVYRWSGVAQCESGGNWSINTGNGYYGGLQFLLSTWRSVGGQGYPHQNTPGEQAYRAEILKNRSGLGQWPVCGRYYR